MSDKYTYYTESNCREPERNENGRRPEKFLPLILSTGNKNRYFLL